MNTPTTNRPTGMMGFSIVWFGQLISLVGSGLTYFALSLWAWEATGSATALALVNLFAAAPTILISPIAGALVDRWNRKLVLMLSDLAAGLSTIVILLLYLAGRLEVWHLYVTGAFAGVFQAFQWPAYSAAISTMVPKEQYGRANGMLALAQSASIVAAPILAAFFIATIGIGGVIAIDIVTFVFAVGTIAFIHVPQPERSAEGEAARGSLRSESLYGFRYIRQRPSLLGLQLIFFVGNLLATFTNLVLVPMILARTGNNEQVLGTVLSVGGIGGVLGGAAMSAWGGPRPRVHGVLLGWALAMVTTAALGLGAGVVAWSVALFLSLFFLPIINGSNQAIWQAKVAPDIQGRVFAARLLIAQVSFPLAAIFVGPLADRVFEPAMRAGGAWADLFGPWVGTGAGAGMALMMVVFGLLGTVTALGGYLFPAIRNAETILPDHDGARVEAETPVAMPLPVEPQGA